MKKGLIFGALGVMALAFASCSSDEPTGYENEKAEYDQMRYIAVQISSPKDNASRGFEHGTTNESYIDRLDFFFYDVAGNPTSKPLTIQSSDMVEENFTEKPSDNVTRIYTSVVPVQLTQGQNLPSQVICIVNGYADNLTKLKDVTLSGLIDVMRDTYRNGNYFIMTNSVYYGQNILTGQANQRLCATPINANSQLFGTEDKAKEAIENAETAPNALVDIYVERLAAKVGLTMASTAVQPYVLQNGEAAGGTVSLTFTPEYWAMNATDEEVYLTKRYGVENAEGTINLTPNYNDINTALTNGGFSNWNNPDQFRSYWGCSPSYFANNYPDVSDDVNDLNGYEADYQTNYYSYKQVKAQANRTAADAGTYGIGKQALAAAADGSFTITNTGDNTTGYIYTRETTVAKSRINNIATGNPAAAVASAVLVGKYKVTGATGDATTFYIDRNAGEGGTYYASEATAKTKLAARQAIVFTMGQNDVLVRAGASIFTLAHPTLAVRTLAATKLAGRLVTLQLKELPGDAIYYYDITANGGEGGYVQIEEDDLDDVNAQLLSVGYMDMFADGLAFFSVPIRHLNWNDQWFINGTYDWEKMQSGSLGVVRNHVYNLTISSVKGLGTGLRNPDQPIVPAKEEANQYIAARLNILAWNVANTWSVNL